MQTTLLTPATGYRLRQLGIRGPAVLLAQNSRITAGGPGSGCYGDNCGRPAGGHPEASRMQDTLREHGYKLHPASVALKQQWINHETRDYVTLDPQTGIWHRKDSPENERGAGHASLKKYLGASRMTAGGPGSGCHGPNCGRPKGKAPEHAINRSYYPLRPMQHKVETKFRREISKDPAAAIERYKEQFGNVLNADNAKELSADYRANRTDLAMAVHEPASWLVKEMYKQDLAKEAEPPHTNSVFFTAGGAGAGKTSAIEKDTKIANMSHEAQIVFDGTLRPADSAIAKIQQALDAGKEAVVAFVHRDPVDAFQNGVLPRAIRIGRTVPIGEFAAQYSTIQNSMAAVQKHFADNPRFRMIIIDNSRGPGNARVVSGLDQLAKHDTDKAALLGELKGILKREYDKGNISGKIYRATLGHDTEKEIGV